MRTNNPKSIKIIILIFVFIKHIVIRTSYDFYIFITYLKLLFLS